MTINKSGSGLLNPVTPVKEKYLISQHGSAELIRAITGGGALFKAKHLLVLGEERHDGQKNCDYANDATLKGLVRDLKGNKRSLILQVKNTCAWLSVQSTTISDKVLSAS